MKRLIRHTFPEDPYTALAVAECESEFLPHAYNDKNGNGTADSGVYQINSIHWERMERLGLDHTYAPDNVEFARILYEEQNWNPWVCYHKLALR